MLLNLEMPKRFVNNLAQARPLGAGREVARFVVNTTAGIGGLFDLATGLGIKPSPADAGTTLALFGFPPGPFLVLPSLPPLTVRDAIGRPLDGALDPISYFLPFFANRAKSVITAVNNRSLELKFFAGVEESVLDLYSAARNGYLQRRRMIVRLAREDRNAQWRWAFQRAEPERAMAAVARRRGSDMKKPPLRPARDTGEGRPELHAVSSAIVVRDLRREYGDVEVVRGVSLDIREGEIFGLLGPNAAGKTTLLSMISTRIRPTSGDAWIFGKHIVHDVNAVRRLLNVAPQEEALYPSLTAEENLKFFADLYGVPRTERRKRVTEALEAVGLTARKDDRVSTYSGGMRRRLNLGCTLVSGPKLVLLDEPTVAVDPQSRAHIFDAVRALARPRRHHRLHHALPRGGGGPLRPHRHHGRGPRGGLRHAARAARPVATPPRSSTCGCWRRRRPSRRSKASRASRRWRWRAARCASSRGAPSTRFRGSTARSPAWGTASSARASPPSRSTTSSSSSPARNCATDARWPAS